MRTERLQREYDVDVVVTQFPLHPDTPDEGLLLTELFAGRRLDLDAMHAAMQARMEEVGLPYAKRDRTVNSRRAQELAKLAEERGKPEIHDALFRTYFAEGRNLAKLDVLADIARGVGIDPDEALRAIAAGTFAQAVDADWARASELGVTGVPTYVVGHRGVVGAQPYEVLERLVTLAGAVPRAK